MTREATREQKSDAGARSMGDRFRFTRPVPPAGLLRLTDLEHVVSVLRAGGLAVLPTETGHMLAALATSYPALYAAFRAKQRDTAHPMHIACSSLEMANHYAEISPQAEILLGTFTPGPLTVIVPQRDPLPRELVTLAGTVGIRVPEHPATLQVVAALGAPVTATSVNRSGEEALLPDRSVLASMDWDGLDEVPVVLDPAAARHSRPSTLVRLTEGSVDVLRAGPITLADVERVLAGVTA